jgi:peptide/nickel transport system substrate-binding protein
MDMAASDKEAEVARRQLLKMVGGTAAVAGLAGCSGLTGDDDDDRDEAEDLGERVPEIVIQFWSGHPVWESAVPLIQNDIEDAIDHDVEARPVEVSRMVGDAYNDERTYHYATWGTTSSAMEVDPGIPMQTDMVIGTAGANGEPNPRNYASCEFSELVHKQRSEGDIDKRRELLEDAMVQFSQDRPDVPFLSRDIFTAVRTDRMSMGGVGEMAQHAWNPSFYAETTPVDGDQWVFGADDTGYWERTNHLMQSAGAIGMFSVVGHSPLVKYDENWELTNELAEDYTVADNSQTFRFELKEGATFHNGDPVTAEHVKFTMEALEDNPFPQRVQQDYTSIEVIDDHTIEFNFDEPNPSFVSGHLIGWGILHKPTWEEADDLTEFDPEPPVVGSGPLHLTSFTRGESVVWESHPDGHVNYPDNDTTLIHQKYDEAETKRRALVQGEIDVAGNMSGAGVDQVKDELGGDVEIVVMRGFGTWHLPAAYPRPPVRYNAFQDAIGKSLNRNALNQAVYANNGKIVTTSAPYVDNHPFYPEDESRIHNYTDDLSGDPEGAREVLTDAGWGWDDDGNLRYPADLDPQPMWPKGETPGPEEFPCVNEDGDYVP